MPSGRHRALAMVLAAALLWPAAAAAFPDFDPKREQIVLGRVRSSDAAVAGSADTFGTFEEERGTLRRATGGSELNALWLAKAPAGHVGDGLVRFRVVPGKRADVGLLKKRAMVFTTNKELSVWGQVLHDNDLGEAIVDRVLERGRLIRLDPSNPSPLEAESPAPEPHPNRPDFPASKRPGECIASIASSNYRDQRSSFHLLFIVNRAPGLDVERRRSPNAPQRDDAGPHRARRRRTASAPARDRAAPAATSTTTGPFTSRESTSDPPSTPTSTTPYQPRRLPRTATLTQPAGCLMT